MQPGAFPGRFGADRGEVVGFDVAADGGGAVAGVSGLFRIQGVVGV